MRFHDREHAGRLLAVKLDGDRYRNAVVLGLTRGGMPVALEVARQLDAPLDMIVVRKISLPGTRSQAIGAIAEGGATFMNPTVLRETGLADEEVAALAEAEVAELSRRVRLYRGERPPPHLAGRSVIVVDDGVVTGVSARAAGRAVRQRGARRVVLAAPVVAAAAEPELRQDFDEVVALETPAEPFAIGDRYQRFEEVGDDQVLACLRRGFEEAEWREARAGA
ncbi:MAG TPA: phosphoribosyltransferase family protein [Anaeromyxobacteraceae bacterium]